MKILDRYIIKNFLITFVFTILLLTVISVVIDTSEKADDFVKSGLTTSQIVVRYYIGFVPFIISMIFPLMVFIAVIYFTSKLAGRSEIVAVLASGVRYRRFYGLILPGAVYWVYYCFIATCLFFRKAIVYAAIFKHGTSTITALIIPAR